MNKLIIFTLLSLTILTYATGHPGKNGTDDKGPENGKGKFFTKCALENCKKEVDALKKLKHAPKEMDECSKKCHEKHNPDNKKYRELDEDQIKKLKSCLVENKCTKDKDAKFNHRNSTEFQDFKKCIDEKCPNDFKGPKFATTPVSTN